MSGDGILVLGCALAIGGLGTLRLSWSRTGRSSGLNTLGWAGLAGAGMLAGLAEGAWGIAIAALFAMATAALLLARAALEQPRSKRRATHLPRAATEHERADRTRAITTLLLAGPVALAVAVAAALASRSLAIRWPVAEADANVMVLALVPLLWPLLTFAILMVRGRDAQDAGPAASGGQP
ncbi:MAG: hypothetical protein AB3N06_02865 [Erythrobacter sp.]